MADSQRLLIIGASARAAAFSALRAGLRPWCADLFADADLQARCHATRLPVADYPKGFAGILAKAPPGPWMYTGGLENYPGLVQEIARRRELWGNDAETLKKARSPAWISQSLAKDGLPCPAFREQFVEVPPGRRWLVKPLSGTGGVGIVPFSEATKDRKHVYFQEFIEGLRHSAVYVSDGRIAALLGITEQLVGEKWLHAEDYQYCGSIGPLLYTPGIDQMLMRIGQALVAGCHLRGLFGVDYIFRHGDILPVEVNPRYTSSVEVLEHGLGIDALEYHRRQFDPFAPKARLPGSGADNIGKAILFARDALTFPAEGPWREVLASKRSVKELPKFADIPNAGERIEKGRPILTFFAQTESEEDCRTKLQETAASLDRLFFG